MKSFITHIRPITFVFNALVAIGIFVYVLVSVEDKRLVTIRLTQYFALYSVVLLYVSLLASPLYNAFPYLSTRALHIKARKALGVSAYFFALLHGSIAFFLQLGGFTGLAYLTPNYLFAITLSFTALVIMSLMALTSLRYFIVKLGKRWKAIHRLVYLASLFIAVHALMVGTHFSDISALIPQMFIYALTILLLLEAYRLDGFISSKFKAPQYVLFAVLGCAIAVVSYRLMFAPDGSTMNIHAKHLQGQQAATGRYEVKQLDPQPIEAGKKITLAFQLYDTEQKKTVRDFTIAYEKLIHMMVVNNSLTYFSHVHPIKNGDTFAVEIIFPKDDTYHIFLNYQPIGFQEQVSTFTVNVGNTKPTVANQTPDSSFTKAFGNSTVALSTNTPFSAASMNAGRDFLTFTISDTNTKKPVTDLEPYLGAFGHLTMINKSTYAYIHVHPAGIAPANSAMRGGPSVQFVPLALPGRSIAPGVYRLFGEFKRGGRVFNVDYTILIQS